MDELAALDRVAGHGSRVLFLVRLQAQQGYRSQRTARPPLRLIVTAAKGYRLFRSQGPGFAVALLPSVIARGTICFIVTRGRGIWDAFYMTVLALTTVEAPSTVSRAGQ